MKEIEYIESYYDVAVIKDFYTEINDDFSGGPYDYPRNKLGWQGCYDRPLRLEIPDNPVHQLFDQIQSDFGKFASIYDGSVRYLNGPFLPHTDITDYNGVKHIRDTGNYGTFVIPLSWKPNYQPGTVFYTSPPNFSEPLYGDCLDDLPEYSDDSVRDGNMFSVSNIFNWKNPGDLIFWYGLKWHGTTDTKTLKYSKSAADWVKEFITIRVFFEEPVKIQ